MKPQPQPTPGREDVTPCARQLFLEVLDAQAEKGIAKHGMPLQTFNGRDAALDLLMELADGVQYAVQLMLECAALRRRIVRLEGALSRLAHLPVDRDAPLDAVVATVGTRKLYAEDIRWARTVLNTPQEEE